MTGLEYQAPASVDDAVGLLARFQGDARVLAGGTDLLVQLRSGRLKPGLVVDVKHIPEMREIKDAGDHFWVGGAVSCAELGEHEVIGAAWPGVVEASELIGSTQIQGRATPTGNLCNASPAADSVPAMIAAGARCVIAGPDGRRELPVEQVQKGPGKNALAKGELVVGFKIPKPAAHSGDAYLRLIPRTEMDIAVVGVGVALTVDAGGTVTAARVALGAVAPTALLVGDAAKAIIGSKLDDAALEKLDAAARAACKPIDDKRGTVAYRTKIAGVLARRAAKIAYDRARGR
ncbi:MAG: xanthine dehydrogenase family protein subunit M [Ectothiorhodospiraceae bacterium]|nr:xanthine dehydrogenase family protein subunit M [Chromatiales bacterium]MCP5156276.1 xanthine dehydrogenase family protein subunit M [Ectothiorhodospiraceae bacterium]